MSMTLIDKCEAIIKSKCKVCYLLGSPGTGKSSVAKAIAERNGWNFIDIRLSMFDSSEILGIPDKIQKDDENKTRVMIYDIPEWAYEANNKPSLIFFDELNRATLECRNAALQILLDRKIGYKFKFNDNVHFAAAGNLGEEDGCEVEEFDKALKDRLATVRFEMTIPEWKENFADKRVNSYFIKFLECNPTYFHKTDDEKSNNFATPRSWTDLSDFCGGTKANLREIKRNVVEFGQHYVGNSISRLIRYLEDQEQISINDVLARYDQVEPQLKTVARDKINELVKELEEKNINKMKKAEVANVVKFLGVIFEDERISFFKNLIKNYTNLVDEEKIEYSDNVKTIIKAYKDDFSLIFLQDSKEEEEKK